MLEFHDKQLCLLRSAQDKWERHTRAIYDHNNAKRNKGVWHASSSGSCIRKVVFDQAIERGLPYHSVHSKILALHNENENDKIFVGRMTEGHLAHKEIEELLQFNGILEYGDWINSGNDIEEHLHSVMRLEEETGEVIIEVEGTADGILKAFDKPEAFLVDFQTIGDAEASRKAKEAITYPNTDVKFVKPGLQKAMQLTVYEEGMYRKQSFHLTHPPVICYIHGKRSLFWAFVSTQDLIPLVHDYWIRVADAWYHYCNVEHKLPEARPEQRWQCKWKSGQCKYYPLCATEMGWHNKPKRNRKTDLNEELNELLEE